MGALTGDIDTTYLTNQRDMFASGLAASVGPNGIAVWLAIKSHADFNTGEAWCGVRRIAEMAGISPMTAQRAIKTLQDKHLLRVVRRDANRHVYVARERMDVRIGTRVIATVAIDYVPMVMRERLEKLKQQAAKDFEDSDVWVWADLYPGEGLEWDPVNRKFTGRLRADEVPVRDDLDALPAPEKEAVVPNQRRKLR